MRTASGTSFAKGRHDERASTRVCQVWPRDGARFRARPRSYGTNADGSAAEALGGNKLTMRIWQLILLLTAVAACDSPIHAVGVVRDERGLAVPGATVSIWRVEQSGAASGQTDSTGHFAVVHTGGPRGRVIVQACRPGYAMAQQAWPDERAIPDTIVLVLKEPVVADAAGGC